MTMIKQSSPKIYNTKYFLSRYLEGYEAFKKGQLSTVKSKQLNMLALKQGTTLLEIGFGRGELLYHCARKGSEVTGIDFSRDAFEICRETLREFPNADIRVGNCTELPFEANSFERVFSGDVIEHLCYEDAILMLKEMYRVLKPGGFMLVHTTPNTVFIKIFYPLVKQFLKLVNKDAVQAIDSHRENSKKVHLNEHSLISLRKVGIEAGLIDSEVWIDKDILRSGKHRHTEPFGKNFLVKFTSSCGKYSIIRFLFGNDLYLKCYKK